jgi:hypothetical protein
MKSVIATLSLLLLACNGKLPAAGATKVSVTAQEGVKDDFEKDNPKWTFAAGKWERRNGVLSQTAETQPWAVAVLEDRKFADVDLSVKVKPLSGKEDQTGGLIFRAKDAKTYYLVRSNGLEDNYRLYTMTDGKRRQIASTKVDPPKVGEWHTLRVVAKGTKIQAYLNDKLAIDHDDATFTEGWVGLWTKADSVTEFDDLKASGTAK